MKNAKVPAELGRIRLLPLALLILIAGLWLEKWWWQVGLYVVITLFVLAYLRYRGPSV